MKWLYSIGVLIVFALLLFIVWGKASSSAFLYTHLEGFFSAPSLVNENRDLRGEVESLRAQIAQQEVGIQREQEGVYGKVFSLYPFNTKQRIYINKGEDDGVVIGSAVVVSDRVLIGEVVEVFSDTSEVMSIFDSRFSLPVRVGEEEVDGLLEGGLSPRLSFIDKSKKIENGDYILSANRSFPYGLLGGYVDVISEDESGAFLVTSISIPYNMNDIRDVTILPRYEE